MSGTTGLKRCSKAQPWCFPSEVPCLSLIPVPTWHPLWPRKEWSRSWWHPMLPQAAREREKKSGKSPKKAMQSYIGLTTPRLRFAATQFGSKARTVNIWLSCLWIEVFGSNYFVAHVYFEQNRLETQTCCLFCARAVADNPGNQWPIWMTKKGPR